jgi:hypothetical protein
MKKFFLVVLSLFIWVNSYSQDKILINNELIKTYLDEYIYESISRGVDVENELLEKLDYILIMPPEKKVCDLGETNLKGKFIMLSHVVTIDRIILKVTLYRELFYVLGVPYNKGSVIMNRKRNDDFSFVAFDDPEIMNLEFSTLINLIKI